jgi:CheY-like chemotaxis protein
VSITPHHLLVVDDQPFIGRIIAMHFERGPFRVSIAEDGPSALAFLRANVDVELVLLDVNLPGMSGLDVMEEVRKDLDIAHIPFVVLTATGQSANRERARALGAAGFVTKPFSPNKLYQQVCDVLGERYPEDA